MPLDSIPFNGIYSASTTRQSQIPKRRNQTKEEIQDKEICYGMIKAHAQLLLPETSDIIKILEQ